MEEIKKTTITKTYLNLTNGIEFLDKFNARVEDIKFVRIQSCACERHLWDKLINELDYNFLLDLALGYEVVVWDTSARKRESRAMYQGLKLIEYVLNRIWFDREVEIKVKDMNCKSYFEEAYKSISDKTKNKIRYVKKFLNTDEIKLKSICFRTNHDGDYEYYKKILMENC